METIVINSDGTQTNERTGKTLPPRPGAHHIYDAGADLWIDTKTLEGTRISTWARIKLAREAAELSDFTCAGLRYQADKARITGAAHMALLAQVAGLPYSIDWTLSDNTTVTLDAAGMIAVGAALVAQVSGAFAIARGLRELIATEETIGQLEAIVWPVEVVK
ncbi:DUF4376 domain-containing protein [Janthinobacterium aestuarii]